MKFIFEHKNIVIVSLVLENKQNQLLMCCFPTKAYVNQWMVQCNLIQAHFQNDFYRSMNLFWCDTKQLFMYCESFAPCFFIYRNRRASSEKEREKKQKSVKKKMLEKKNQCHAIFRASLISSYIFQSHAEYLDYLNRVFTSFFVSITSFAWPFDHFLCLSFSILLMTKNKRTAERVSNRHSFIHSRSQSQMNVCAK